MPRSSTQAGPFSTQMGPSNTQTSILWPKPAETSSAAQDSQKPPVQSAPPRACGVLPVNALACAWFSLV
jgi:hypothetical protein